MEGASASVIEEMLFSKAVIVSDTGFYAELPDTCVVKVTPRAQGDLVNALGRLTSESGQAERKRLGLAAGQYARNEFSPQHYAMQALEFAEEVRSARPLLALTDKLGAECNRIGIAADMQIIERLGIELNELFNA